jgi:hypothetical protein
MLRKAPHEEISDLARELRGLSDEQLLIELRRLPVLPDDAAEDWRSDETWRAANRYVAIGDVAAERKLKSAVRLLLERASYGDPGEMMRGLRHVLEAIATPDWSFLATAYVDALSLPHRGARLWAVAGLGVLRDASTMPVLLQALRDPAVEVCKEACRAIRMVCQEHAVLRDVALEALASCSSDPELGAAAKKAAAAISAGR